MRSRCFDLVLKLCKYLLFLFSPSVIYYQSPSLCLRVWFDESVERRVFRAEMDSPYEAPHDTSLFKPPAAILLDEPADPTKAGDSFKDYRKEKWPQSEAFIANAARQDPHPERVVSNLLIYCTAFFKGPMKNILVFRAVRCDEQSLQILSDSSHEVKVTNFGNSIFYEFCGVKVVIDGEETKH